MKNDEKNNDLFFENSSKQFIQLIKKYNKIAKKPEKQISIYDKIHNYFSKIAFHKLNLLGEDLNNYGSVIIGGVAYSPKAIKIDYFGDRKKQKEFDAQRSSSKNKKRKKGIIRTEINQNISENLGLRKSLKSMQPVKIYENQNSLTDNISLPPIRPFIPSKKKKIKNISTTNEIEEVSRNKINIESMKNVPLRSKSFDTSLGELPRLISANTSANSKINSSIRNRDDDKKIEMSQKILVIKNKLNILEKKARIETNLIERNNKINEEGKPQFKRRFKYLNSMFIND